MLNMPKSASASAQNRGASGDAQNVREVPLWKRQKMVTKQIIDFIHLYIPKIKSKKNLGLRKNV